MTECTEYGPKIQNAIKAVAQMYEDTKKLLVDCNGTIGKGKESVFGVSVTRDMSKDLQYPAWWMPRGVYRFYRKSKQPAHLEGVTAAFYDPNENIDFSEPLFIVGQFECQSGDIDPWTLWNGFRQGERISNKVINLSQPDPDSVPGIKSVQLIAVPLYSIKRATCIRCAPKTSPDDNIEETACVQCLLNKVKQEVKTSA